MHTDTDPQKATTASVSSARSVVYRDLDASSSEELAAVRHLLDEVSKADGVPAYGEAFLRALDSESADSVGYVHMVAVEGDELLGVVSMNSSYLCEIAVHPDHRRRGIGSELLRILGRSLDGDQQLSVWSHGALPGAMEFADHRQSRLVRELLKMTVDCDPTREESAARRADLLHSRDKSLAKIQDAGYRVLDYVESSAKFGGRVTDAEWLRVNNEAFAWHPEQGGWDMEKFLDARDVDWFDPNGVLLLWQDEECVGFHWTKRPDGDPHGEVYVVCLADAARGKGLGTPMTLLGMGYLLDNGARAIDLYVEGDNVPAVATYEKLGFTVAHRDVVFRGIL
ncbi:MAG: mycothiol synthase [Candidatus Corynebacterium faecigallinarum]